MGEKLTLAVTEDDDSFSRSLGRLLGAAGYGVVTYPSSEAFLADPHRPRFDCLLLDVQLPGISGIELADQLVRAGSMVPVVFLTADHGPETRARAGRIPRTTFLLKTEPADVLFAAIRGAIQSGAGRVTEEDVE